MQLNLISKVSLSLIILLFDTGLHGANVVQAKHSIVSQPSVGSARERVGSISQEQIDAAILVQQGRELYEAEKFSQAVQVWQQAALAYQARKDKLTHAMVLSNLSLAYQQLGQWRQARIAIASCLNLLGYSGGDKRAGGAGGAGGAGDAGGEIQNPKSKIQNLEVLAQALNTQGSLQLGLGQAQQALNTWQIATATYSAVGDVNGMIRSQINSAQALQALGLYRRALKTITQVKQTLHSQPDSLLKAASLRNLGNQLRVVGEASQSELTLQQSLALAQKLKSPDDIGATLFALGNTARTTKDYKAALTFYQQAAIYPSQTTQLQAQLNQLSLLLDIGQPTLALALIPEIQTRLTKLPPSSSAVYARIDFAQSLMKLGARREQGEQGELGELGELGSRGAEGQRGQVLYSITLTPHPSPLTPHP